MAAQEPVQTIKVETILKLEMSSTINPGTLKYIEYNLSTNKDVDLIHIQMNTPGGLLTSTKKIINSLVKAKKPYQIWIGPSGSSATSAGAIIASSANFLSMSEGTNIGAATPIQTTGDIKKESDLRAKAINDIKSLVRAQAELHNRNPSPFEQMIENAKSYSAGEAMKLNFIDNISNSQKEAIQNIDKKVTKIGSKKIRIEISPDYKLIEGKMDLGLALLNILSSPDLAYILFIIGAALLYLELQAPGGFIAGSLGVVFLLVAGISFQVLPLNMGALGLILLSFVLFILEIYITSFGILSIGAVASLITGSLFLFRTNDSYLEVSRSIILASSAAVISFMALIVYIFLKGNKEVGKSKFNDPCGEVGIVTQKIKDHTYMVKTHGEFWRIHCEQELEIDDHVKLIKKQEDLTYLAQKMAKEDI